MGWQSEDYYNAALERIREARFLHDHGYFVVVMYLSGLAVECLLRAFRLLKDSTFDERHDLWLLWKSTVLANFHSAFYQEKIHSSMSVIRLLWRNDYRFCADHAVRAHLKNLRRDRRIKGNFLKFNSQVLYEASAEIIRLGGQTWKQLNGK